MANFWMISRGPTVESGGGQMRSARDSAAVSGFGIQRIQSEGVFAGDGLCLFFRELLEQSPSSIERFGRRAAGVQKNRMETVATDDEPIGKVHEDLAPFGA